MAQKTFFHKTTKQREMPDNILSPFGSQDDGNKANLTEWLAQEY
jgi:hypothetical protein